VSIKNDGHYFCRAGGNRPDGLNEPVTLNMLHDSINKLGEAIKKDEEYAQETRRQLDDIRSRLNGIMTQKSVTESSSTPHPAKKKTSSVLNGMKIMSMETGMAWIRWQGSTWAVREGQTLGNVVIQRIDPTTESTLCPVPLAVDLICTENPPRSFS
ncbi:conjugal transfer protein TraP, partial [Escherichia coli]|nr:conjugal transfer protein TraP [Escherichia coli]MDA6365286.1 conjugal transfer protein TraP [Escherichia coli]MDA6374759.1 conjugal transfer protein TraP [Escherichia coli]MDA6393585.1 conjugal transfer protein TraP [Escherichia coli]